VDKIGNLTKPITTKGDSIMPRQDNYTGEEFEGYKLTDTDHEYSKTYLRKGIQMVTSMTKRHSKVLQTRMDFRYPQSYQSDGTNEDFSTALKTFSKELSRKRYDPQYIARREQKKSNNPHLHVSMVVDGNKKRCRASMIESAEKHWANALGIPVEEVHENQLVYPCNKDPEGNPRPNGYMIDRNKPDFKEMKNNAIRQMSYLAKKDPEDITPSSTRKFFTSQFGKDYDQAMERKQNWIQRNIASNDIVFR